MPKNVSKAACEKFQKYAVELINSGTDPEDAQRHPHANACADCSQFLRDLTIISDAAHSLLPHEWKSVSRPN